jgi:hypothetical protein
VYAFIMSPCVLHALPISSSLIKKYTTFVISIYFFNMETARNLHLNTRH